MSLSIRTPNRSFIGLLASVAIFAIAFMTPSAHGQIFVTTSTGVAEYNLDGSLANASLISGSGFGGIAVSGSDLFVTNYSNGTVGEYNAFTGAAIYASLISGLSSPYSIAVSGSNLFVQNGNNVDEYSTSGGILNASLISSSGNLQKIAVSGSNLFLVSGTGMSSTVSIYPTSGGAGITLIQEQNIFPTSIAAFGSNVFVANQLNVSEYNFSGGLINASFGGGAGGPIETIATSESGLFELNISSNQTLREYDAITGATINASLITGLNTGYIAVEGTAVPEPSTYAAIMGFASVGFVMVRRRFVRK